MGTQQLPLCWNSHKTEILTTFQRLLVEESFVDVTLACEGISLKAHKTILSACSPFFHDLFLENPCKHPIVIMKDIKYRDLKGIIDFMYHGGINVAPDQLSDFLKAAEALKVKGLSEHPSMSIDLNKQLKMQQKSPHKTKHPSSHLQNAPTVIKKQRENCEQQLVNAKEYPTSNGGDGCTVAEEPNTISIKSEPETNDDTDCEEVFPEHSLHDDSLLSVHYDERFEPQMEITEDTQNLVLVPSCQQELTSNALPYSSEATTCNRVLPVESTSAESLGVIISPDISDNPEQVVHYSSYEPSTIAAHSTSAHDMKTATVMQYEESNDYSVSNQLYQRYSPEQTAFISNEQEGDLKGWAEYDRREQGSVAVFSHPSQINSGKPAKGKQNINYQGNTINESYTVLNSKNSTKPGNAVSRGYTLGNLRDAVNAVKHGMPLRQAQQLFKVPRTTIHSRVKGQRPVILARSGRYPLLGKEIEEELKETLKGIDECVSNIPIERCLELAYSIAEKAGKADIFPSGSGSRRWFTGFLKRHNLT